MKGFLDVNSKWLEALDSSSGEQRVYYIDRSTQETAWVPPEPFMDRSALAASYMALVAEIERSELECDDDAAFLSKVRQRFPPPPRQPPGAKPASSGSVVWKRGASLIVEEPPPPPAWAITKARGANDCRPTARTSAPSLAQGHQFVSGKI